MPVTAKLSRRFYEQFGDEVTNELVNWFNAVDETYRNQLRELNELNWERFRSELRAEGASIRAELDKRLSTIEAKLASLEAAFPASEERAEARLQAAFARCETRMYRRMFFFWTATTVPLAGLILALSDVFQR